MPPMMPTLKTMADQVMPSAMAAERGMPSAASNMGSVASRMPTPAMDSGSAVARLASSVAISRPGREIAAPMA